METPNHCTKRPPVQPFEWKLNRDSCELKSRKWEEQGLLSEEKQFDTFPPFPFKLFIYFYIKAEHGDNDCFLFF